MSPLDQFMMPTGLLIVRRINSILVFPNTEASTIRTKYGSYECHITGTVNSYTVVIIPRYHGMRSKISKDFAYRWREWRR